MKIHAFGSWPHYVEHLFPVYNNLPEDCRGDLLAGSEKAASELRALGIPAQYDRKAFGQWEKADVVLLAGHADVRKVRSRIAFFEHGAGQTYEDALSGSYAGGPNREKIGLFLCPSERVAELNNKSCPKSCTKVVGSPRLDYLSALRAENYVPDAFGTIAFSFHWDCRVSQESNTAFPEWRDAVAHYAQGATSAGINVIGHGHPKNWPTYKEWWETQGVEPVSSWTSVAQQADLLVVDNSSILFEALALDIPVVLLNSSSWRQDVNHGLRFWDYSDVGPSLWPGDNLGEAIAASGDGKWAERRRTATTDVYTYPADGTATKKAVEAVLAWSSRERNTINT